MLAGRHAVAAENELIVEREQIGCGDMDFFLLRACHRARLRSRHVGLVFAAGLEILGQGLDRQARIAGRIPIAGMLAIVEQILHQARGHVAVGLSFAGRLHLSPTEKLEIASIGFDFAAIPVPPGVGFGELEIGSLILRVLDHKLTEILENHRELFRVMKFFQREAEHGLAVHGQIVAVAV